MVRLEKRGREEKKDRDKGMGKQARLWHVRGRGIRGEGERELKMNCH